MEWDGGFGGGSHEEEEKRDPAQDYLDAWRRRQEEIDRKSPGTGWGGDNPVPRPQQPEYGGDDGGGDDHHHDDYHKPEVPVYGEEAGGENDEDHGEHRKPEVPVYTAPETTADATEETAGAAEIKPANAAQATETIVYEGVGTGGQKAGPDASGTKDALTEEEEKEPEWMTYGAGTGRRSGEERADRTMAGYKPKQTTQPTAGNMTAPQQHGGNTASKLESQWFNADGTPKPNNEQESMNYVDRMRSERTYQNWLTEQTKGMHYSPEVGAKLNQEARAEIKRRQDAAYRADNPPAGFVYNPATGNMEVDTGQTYHPGPNVSLAQQQGMRGGVPTPATGVHDEQWLKDFRDAQLEGMQDGAKGQDLDAFARDVADQREAERTGTKWEAPKEPTAEEYAEQMGIPAETLADKDFQKYYENLKKQGQSNASALANAVALYNGTRQDRIRELTSQAEDELVEELGLDYTGMNKEQADKVHKQAEEIAEERYNPADYAASSPMTDTEKMRHQPGYSYVPAVQSQTPKEPRKSAYDLDAVMGSGEMVYDPERGDFVYQPKTVPTTGGTNAEKKAEETPAGTSSGTTGSGTGNGSGTGSKDDVPPGSQYFRPSYGQDMEKVVKAPYRKGGYTEEEIRAMGNVEAGKDRYSGKNFYEGYYLAPDQHYYPVDQIKANYYNRYGTYNGWQEGMRDYWNTFGTFYGYRPNWKVTGRGGGGRRYYGGGGGGSSYGRGGTSSGNNGSTNGGMYWNGNTSWSI